MKKIGEIVIKKIIDKSPDTSWLGEYTDEITEGVIVRQAGDYFENLPEDYEIPRKGRELRAFRPYAGGEKIGTKEYYEYGMQDFKRMESLNSGYWCFIGIGAEAKILTSHDGKSWLINKVSSGGLWGIESDAGDSYFEKIKKGELAELTTTLKEIGFSCRAIAQAIKKAEWEEN